MTTRRRLGVLIADEGGRPALPAGAIVGRSVELLPLPGAVAASDSPAAPGSAPTCIHVAPIGEWNGYRNHWGEKTTVRITAADIAKMVENQQEMGDVPGDYGHALLYEYDAKACGWGKKLEAREDGAWLEVDWTPAAKAAIEAKEFRYISPVIVYQYTHPESGAEMGTFLHSFALTNTPFFKLDLQPLTARARPAPAAGPVGGPAARSGAAASAPAPTSSPAAPAATTQETPPMDWRALLLASLKVASDISDDDLKAAAEQHFTQHDTLVTATRKALSLADDADLPGEVEGQLVAATSRAGFVPLAEVESIRATAYAEGQQAGTAAAVDPVVAAKAKADEAIEAGLQRGAITAATRKHWDALAESDPEQCAQLVASLPDGAAVPTGTQGPKADPTTKTVTATNKPKHSKLTDEQWIAAEQKRDAQRAARKGVN